MNPRVVKPRCVLSKSQDSCVYDAVVNEWKPYLDLTWVVHENNVNL